MFGVIEILVSNQFIVCCDAYILITDTMQYHNVHIKQNSYLDVLKSQRIQSRYLKNEEDTSTMYDRMETKLHTPQINRLLCNFDD